MLAFDPSATAEENTEAMKAAIGRVTAGSITYAARNSVYEGHDIAEGDFLSLKNGRVSAITKTRDEAVEALLDATGGGEDGIITLFYGESVKEREAEEVADIIRGRFPDAEVSVVNGGQPVYYYILSVE